MGKINVDGPADGVEIGGPGVDKHVINVEDDGIKGWRALHVISLRLTPKPVKREMFSSLRKRIALFLNYGIILASYREDFQ